MRYNRGMNKALTISTTATINAPLTKVWSALVDPEQIKRYLYGTVTETTWEVGTPIRFTGDWEGTPYIDKGEILAFEPQKKLQYTYLSSFTGLADEPQNYSTVTFEVTPKGDATNLTVTQSSFKDETHRDHSKTNWEHVLGGIKKLLEA